MSDEAITAAPEPEEKRGFTLPSAYTILFALIVIAAIATWIIPAGTYKLDKEGEPVPGTYHEVDGQPRGSSSTRSPRRSTACTASRTPRATSTTTTPASLFGAIDVALFIIVIGGFLGVTMRTGAIQAGIGRLVERMRGRERWMIPILMMRVRARRHDVRHGRGEPGVLRARHHGDDRRRLRRAHRRGGRPARLRDRHAAARRSTRSRPASPPGSPASRSARACSAAGDPDRRAGDRHLLRDAVRRPGQDGPDEVGGLRHEGGQRGALQGRTRGRRKPS